MAVALIFYILNYAIQKETSEELTVDTFKVLVGGWVVTSMALPFVVFFWLVAMHRWVYLHVPDWLTGEKVEGISLWKVRELPIFESVMAVAQFVVLGFWNIWLAIGILVIVMGLAHVTCAKVLPWGYIARMRTDAAKWPTKESLLQNGCLRLATVENTTCFSWA